MHEAVERIHGKVSVNFSSMTCHAVCHLFVHPTETMGLHLQCSRGRRACMTDAELACSLASCNQWVPASAFEIRFVV